MGQPSSSSFPSIHELKPCTNFVRSDEAQISDLSHLLHSPTTSWMWKDQRSKCSHGPLGGGVVYDPDFIAIHEDREKKKKKGQGM
jgi:hypothetical protein